ncbi:MAG: hypothetical protein G01um10143_204 [Parcubacteria group bacterium Gr01-1014_3]|nr:MAG: hypothetical protein G01um10143_204 [Parcubacteria group bacterium Gr01-1014_3]
MSAKVLLDSSRLAKIFNRQAAKLIDNNFHYLAGDNDQEFLKGLETLGSEIKKMEDREFHRDALPLLIVIPRRTIQLRYQVAKLKVDGRKGFMDAGVVDNTLPPSHDLYVIFDVEAGHGQKEGDPSDHAGSFNIRGRRGLSIEEGVALAFQDEQVFDGRRYLYLLGADEKIMRFRSNLTHKNKSRVYPALMNSDNGPGLVYSNPKDNKHFSHSVPSRPANEIIYYDFPKSIVMGIKSRHTTF